MCRLRAALDGRELAVRRRAGVLAAPPKDESPSTERFRTTPTRRSSSDRAGHLARMRRARALDGDVRPLPRRWATTRPRARGGDEARSREPELHASDGRDGAPCRYEAPRPACGCAGVPRRRRSLRRLRTARCRCSRIVSSAPPQPPIPPATPSPPSLRALASQSSRRRGLLRGAGAVLSRDACSRGARRADPLPIALA